MPALFFFFFKLLKRLLHIFPTSYFNRVHPGMVVARATLEPIPKMVLLKVNLEDALEENDSVATTVPLVAP